MKRFFVPMLAIAVMLTACGNSTTSPVPPTEVPSTVTVVTVSPVPPTTSPTETAIVPTNSPVPSPTVTPVSVPDYIRNLKLETNPLKFASAPVIQQGDWPALAVETMDRYQRGELGQFPSESRYIPLSYLESGFMYNGMVHILKPLGQPTDLWGMEGRWYYFTSVYREEGTDRVIAHYMVQQKGGTVGQFFSLLGTEKTVRAEESQNLVWYAKGADDIYLEVADFRTTEACIEGWGDELYCQQRVDNRDVDLLLYHQWASDGIVPIEFSSGQKIIVLAGQRIPKPQGE